MGITRVVTLISPKGSGTYLFILDLRLPLHAIPGSGARNPAVQRRAWVRLVVAITGSVPLPHILLF